MRCYDQAQLLKAALAALSHPRRALPCLPTHPPRVTAIAGSIFIDFSPKGGPKDLVGKYDEFGGVPGIVFPDGKAQKCDETCQVRVGGRYWPVASVCELSEELTRECGCWSSIPGRLFEDHLARSQLGIICQTPMLCPEQKNCPDAPPSLARRQQVDQGGQRHAGATTKGPPYP